MNRALHISPDLTLPRDAVTHTFALLAARGAGKTNAARAMAEEMHAAALPFVAIDPVGSWWGLRGSADGKKPGLPIPIFGGRHGDVPLESTGGHLVADLVVDQRLSCVVDVSDFGEAEKARFLTDFAQRLYRRNTDPLHLFLEEADDYIPQKPGKDQLRVLGAFEAIVRRGRARGLGITMITQRSAVINKNVLTQTETLFAMRAAAPQDREAIEAWVKFHNQGRDILASLPELEPGEAWVWSPWWLGLKQPKRFRFRLSWTFDSGATPTGAKAARPPATLADVDLAAIQKDMAATIERAKAEDPRELRRQIVELKRELASKTAAAPKVETKSVERPVFRKGEVERFEKAVEKLNRKAEDLSAIGLSLSSHVKALQDRERAAEVALLTRRGLPDEALIQRSETRLSGKRVTTAPAGPLGAGEIRVLTAIAQHRDGVTREQLTVLTGYKRSSRDTYLQRLKSAQLIELRDPVIVATAAGVSALGPEFRELPTGAALRRYWLEVLPEGERRILEILIQQHPRPVDREELTQATGYQRSSRDTYLQRLKSRQLIVVVNRGQVRASGSLW